MDGKDKENFGSGMARVPVFSEILGEVPFGRTILVLFDPDAQTTALLVKGQNADTKVRRIIFDDRMKPTLQLLKA